MKWPTKGFGVPSVGDPGMGYRAKDAGLRVPGLIDFMWENSILVPVQREWYSPEHLGQSSQSSAFMLFLMGSCSPVLNDTCPSEAHSVNRETFGVK